MKILITDDPGSNGYMESLINAYTRAGHVITSSARVFFFSDEIPDVLHLQWPESLYLWHAPKGMGHEEVHRLIAERLTWYKNMGVTIVHTIHNLAAHDRSESLNRETFQLVIDQSDILVHHCDKSLALLADNYPSVSAKTNIICPHGDYLLHHRTVSKEAARRHYGIPDDRQVILNFGQQRPYKNEHFIYKVFKQLQVQNKYLVIAGTFHYPDNDRWLRLRNRLRVRFPYLDRKYIYRLFPESEIADIISVADIIFLGQSKALNSGLTSLAATFAVPVVCPDIGCLGQSLDGWHHETYQADDARDACRALHHLHNSLSGNPHPDNSAWLRNHTWDNHVTKILISIQENTASRI